MISGIDKVLRKLKGSEYNSKTHKISGKGMFKIKAKDEGYLSVRTEQDGVMEFFVSEVEMEAIEEAQIYPQKFPTKTPKTARELLDKPLGLIYFSISELENYNKNKISFMVKEEPTSDFHAGIYCYYDGQHIMRTDATLPSSGEEIKPEISNQLNIVSALKSMAYLRDIDWDETTKKILSNNNYGRVECLKSK